jgi:hypothetical protein
MDTSQHTDLRHRCRANRRRHATVEQASVASRTVSGLRLRPHRVQPTPLGSTNVQQKTKSPHRHKYLLTCFSETACFLGNGFQWVCVTETRLPRISAVLDCRGQLLLWIADMGQARRTRLWAGAGGQWYVPAELIAIGTVVVAVAFTVSWFWGNPETGDQEISRIICQLKIDDSVGLKTCARWPRRFHDVPYAFHTRMEVNPRTFSHRSCSFNRWLCGARVCSTHPPIRLFGAPKMIFGPI